MVVSFHFIIHVSRIMSPNTSAATTASNTGDDNKSRTNNDNNDRFWIQVSENIPSVEQCYAHCAADASCGAVATFVGVTRNNFNGKRVVKLSYEGYVPMAEKLMRELCVEATSTSGGGDAVAKKNTSHFPSVTRIAMMHILGDCPVGRASVIIAASSPHRTDAMHCTEFLINELKARIPIWKKEVYDEGDGAGTAVWKENVEWHEGRQRRVMVQQDVAEEDQQT
jgi:molybdopterin synthase catalytic subunit